MRRELDRNVNRLRISELNQTGGRGTRRVDPQNHSPVDRAVDGQIGPFIARVDAGTRQVGKERRAEEDRIASASGAEPRLPNTGLV
jgi:hypothetical protein